MPGAASGLQRDIKLVTRRAWLFIPFLAIGLIAAFLFRSVAGDANAAASMQLETVVQDLVVGGDRGLRIFEAQSMTTDITFKEKVRAEIGDPNFDYSRFAIALAPISVADGVSKGILTVSVRDADKAAAEKLREAFISVFTREYLNVDGLFRTRFISKKQEVADLAQKDFNATYARLKPKLDAKGLPADEMIRGFLGTGETLADQANRREADLRLELAQISAALANPATANSSIHASIILKVAVPEGQANAIMQQRQAILIAAINETQGRRGALFDGSLDAALVAEIDAVRSLYSLKIEALVRLQNARVAITSAQSAIETSYSTSGGVAGSLLGRIAVALAVTVVFGLIAIYLWEWLSQLRSNRAPE